MGAKIKNDKKKSQNKLKKNFKSSKIVASANQPVRITRSTSLKIKTVEEQYNNQNKDCFARNTRSKSKTLFVPNSFINTRSKSQKIENITTSLQSNDQQPQNLNNKAKDQSKSLSLSKKQFVKLHDFKVDSVVLAKQKYSIPWPSKVVSIEKERILVYFFGDKRCGYVSKNEIYDFILSVSALKSTISSNKNPRSYKLGITEVEMLMEIPHEYSLLN